MSHPFHPLMIRDVREEDRPRERLIQQGASALSNAELVAILLRTGTSRESAVSLAQRVLSQYGGLSGLLVLGLADLLRLRGIGPAKAVQLLAGIELGRRVSRTVTNDQVTISSPGEAAQLVMDELHGLTQEHFLCLFLNTKNRLIDKQCIFIGTLNAAVVHPRDIYREAIRRSAAGIICIHNHPSGDPSPSQEDRIVTERLFESGQIVGIHLLDHIIIGEHCFISMKEKGWIPQ